MKNVRTGDGIVPTVIKFWSKAKGALIGGGVLFAIHTMQREATVRRAAGIAMNAVRRMPRPRVVRIIGTVPII